MMKNYIKRVRFENFRGIDELELEPRQVTVLVGPNNSGKSSVLDGIGLVLGAQTQFEGIQLSLALKNPKYLIRKGENKGSVTVELGAGESNKKNLKLEFFYQGYQGGDHDHNIDEESLRNDTFDLVTRKETRAWKNIMLEKLKMIENDIDEDSLSIFKNLGIEFAEEREFLFKTIRNNATFFGYFEDSQRRWEGYSPWNSFFDEIHERDRNPGTLFYYFHRKKDEPKIRIYSPEKAVRGARIPIVPFEMVHFSRGTRDFYKVLSSKMKDAPSFLKALEHLREKIYYFNDLRFVDNELYTYLEGVPRKGFQAIPFEMMGDGFKNLVYTTVALQGLKSGVLLIEEPETSLHPGFEELLTSEILAETPKKQFLISTHSMDFLESLVRKAEKGNQLDKITIVQLSHLGSGIERRILEDNYILRELNEVSADLRGY
ncbi:MAG: AAA family ATPase [Promethearchaeota archaeon]